MNALAQFSTSEIFQRPHRYRYQVLGEVMMDMWRIKEMIQCATLGIPKGMKKCNFYFYCFYALPFYQKWKYNFQGIQKKSFEIILHIGRATSLLLMKSDLKKVSRINIMLRKVLMHSFRFLTSEAWIRTSDRFDRSLAFLHSQMDVLHRLTNELYPLHVKNSTYLFR